MPAISRNRTTGSEPPPHWRFGAAPVIGVVGSIGGGKSRVAAGFAARGATVIDADRIGHRVLEETAIRDRVIAHFGREIVARPDNKLDPASRGPRIDRKALGAIVFADPTALRTLESIVHPRMRQEFIRLIEEAMRLGPHPVVLDAAVLLEAGWQTLCDRVVFVDAPRGLRVERVGAQRGWSAESLSAREQSQWPLDQKRRCADLLIQNDSDLAHLEREIDRAWSSFTRADAALGAIAEVGVTA